MIREIIIWPDSLLGKKCEPVTEVNADIKRLLQDMEDTMLANRGAGLAAPQVGFRLRLVTILVKSKGDDGQEVREVVKLVNPEIVERSETKQRKMEGCLSLPGFAEVVPRAAFVKVKALDENGMPMEIAGDGQLAIALQHELEHLDGRMFVDYLSPLKRNMARKRFEKLKAEGVRYPSDSPKPQDFTEQQG